MNIDNYKYRLFGRNRGRNKKSNTISSYTRKIEKYLIYKIEDNKQYILDIGTGYGETSLFLSKNFRDNTIISCEKYIDGNLNLVNKIESNSISNISLFNGNVHEILDANPKLNVFKTVWIFFPDPWPKKKNTIKEDLLTTNF